MKNVLNYYYNFNIDNIHFCKDSYYFDYLNNSYKFREFKRSIDELFSLYKLNLDNYSIYFHKIIKNRDNSIYTVVDGKIYVLLKLSNIIDDKISLYDINYYKYYGNDTIINRTSSINLWSLRVDYLEEKIENNEIGESDLIPIYYFIIGLSENAIRYIYDTNLMYKNYDKPLSICHNRIDTNMSVIDFYDPLELVIDYRVRDIAEYIKSMFFNDAIDILYIDQYISELNFNDFEYSYLMGKILFPSILFDNIDNKDFLFKFNIRKYIDYLEDIYYIIKKNSNIKVINWIIKKI